MHLLAHILGLDTQAGRWYTFWSGVGSDIGEIAVFGALVGLIRKHTCHVHRCWRLGRLEVAKGDGTKHVVCRRHHPDGAPRAGDLR